MMGISQSWGSVNAGAQSMLATTPGDQSIPAANELDQSMSTTN